MKFNLYFFELSITVTNNSLEKRIKQEYFENGKLPAIRLHRLLTNSTLKDSRDYVELKCESEKLPERA